MKKEQLKEIEILDGKVSTKLSDKSLLRIKVYRIVSGVHLLLFFLGFILIDGGDRKTYFFIVNGVFISFYLFYPRDRGLQNLEIETNKLKRTHVSFPSKSTFELGQINEVRISQADIELGRTVWVNYGLGQNRHDLMDSLSLEDADRVKNWVESKLKSNK